ncbi:MAG: hypothetical protein VB980_01070 [Opitutales bacterium]
MSDRSREEVLRAIAMRLVQLDLPHPVRVGVDGVSASGKTIFSDQLAVVLSALGREVIRAGLDGFHNPPETRHRQGPLSIAGYLEDSFDFEAVRRLALDPLGPGGTLFYQSEIYDHRAGESREVAPLRADPRSILVFEGVTLFRKEIVDCFDYKIYLETAFDVALERAKTRDLDHFGDMETLLTKYQERFIPGQRRYIEQYRPAREADAVVGNDDWAMPTLRFS